MYNPTVTKLALAEYRLYFFIAVAPFENLFWLKQLYLVFVATAIFHLLPYLGKNMVTGFWKMSAE
jgi:hypothetical protein